VALRAAYKCYSKIPENRIYVSRVRVLRLESNLRLDVALNAVLEAYLRYVACQNQCCIRGDLSLVLSSHLYFNVLRSTHNQSRQTVIERERQTDRGEVSLIMQLLYHHFYIW
jgi:hypothetical protein